MQFVPMNSVAFIHTNQDLSMTFQMAMFLTFLLVLRWYRKKSHPAAASPQTPLDKALATLIPSLVLGIGVFSFLALLSLKQTALLVLWGTPCVFFTGIFVIRNGQLFHRAFSHLRRLFHEKKKSQR